MAERASSPPRAVASIADHRNKNVPRVHLEGRVEKREGRTGNRNGRGKEERKGKKRRE
jgi:hypothetical protein